MQTTTQVHLDAGTVFLAHDGPEVPYLTIQSPDYASQVHLFLGSGLNRDPRELALRQLDELEAMLIAARRLLAAHAIATPVPGPDDPDDGDPDPVDAVGRPMYLHADAAADDACPVCGGPTYQSAAGGRRCVTHGYGDDQAHQMTESELRYAHGDR